VPPLPSSETTTARASIFFAHLRDKEGCGLVKKVFAPNRTKRLLSGDGRAVFEVMLHGDLWVLGACCSKAEIPSSAGVQGSGFKVQRLAVRDNIEN